jgi:hypothetical protein
MHALKGLFPAHAIPKGKALVLYRTAKGALVVEYEVSHTHSQARPNGPVTDEQYQGKELGKVDDPWMSRELFLAYFADKDVISPKVRSFRLRGDGHQQRCMADPRSSRKTSQKVSSSMFTQRLAPRDLSRRCTSCRLCRSLHTVHISHLNMMHPSHLAPGPISNPLTARQRHPLSHDHTFAARLVTCRSARRSLALCISRAVQLGQALHCSFVLLSWTHQRGQLVRGESQVIEETTVEQRNPPAARWYHRLAASLSCLTPIPSSV